MEEDMKIFGDIPGREKSKLKDCQTRKKTWSVWEIPRNVTWPE